MPPNKRVGKPSKSQQASAAPKRRGASEMCCEDLGAHY